MCLSKAEGKSWKIYISQKVLSVWILSLKSHLDLEDHNFILIIEKREFNHISWNKKVNQRERLGHLTLRAVD